jgi:hypothetical protein
MCLDKTHVKPKTTHSSAFKQNMFNFREFTREEIHELFDSEQQFQRFCVKFELLEGFDICCWNVKDEWTNLFKEKKE